MTIIVDHLVELCYIRMVKLRPYFDFTVYFVEVVDHLHLASLVVADCSLASKRWFVHHFHGEFCNLIGIENRALELAAFSLLLSFFNSGMIGLELSHSLSAMLKTNHTLYLAV